MIQPLYRKQPPPSVPYPLFPTPPSTAHVHSCFGLLQPSMPPPWRGIARFTSGHFPNP